MNRRLQPSPLALLALGTLLFLSSCSTVQIQSASDSTFRYGKKVFTSDIPRATRFLTTKVKSLMRNDGSFWCADDMTGKPSIVIHLGQQMVYLYKGGQLAGGSPISSGSEGYETRPGRYSVIEKDIDHKSSLYGDYEDSYGNVVRQNIDNRKDPRPPGTRFEGAKMLLLPSHLRCRWHAPGLPPRLPGLPRLHSPAWPHGRKILPCQQPGHPRSHCSLSLETGRFVEPMTATVSPLAIPVFRLSHFQNTTLGLFGNSMERPKMQISLLAHVTS